MTSPKGNTPPRFLVWSTNVPLQVSRVWPSLRRVRTLKAFFSSRWATYEWTRTLRRVSATVRIFWAKHVSKLGFASVSKKTVANHPRLIKCLFRRVLPLSLPLLPHSHDYHPSALQRVFPKTRVRIRHWDHLHRSLLRIS